MEHFIDYLFKQRNFDSSSVSSDLLIKKVNQHKQTLQSNLYLTQTEEDLATQEFSIESETNLITNLQDKVKEDISKIEDLIRTRVISLREELEKCEDKVKQALLSEKKLVGETYTAIIPLDKNLTENSTTATIEDNTVFGISFDSKKEVKTQLDLDVLNIVGEEYCEVTSIRANSLLTLNFKQNLYSSFNQIRCILPTITQSGLLYLEFSEVLPISILDENGFEIKTKHLTDVVKFPVDSFSNSFSIRFYFSSKKQIKLINAYYTEAVYNSTTVFETLPISINKDLSFISIETCDNYLNKNIDIKYELSINENKYTEFRPVGKLKNSYVKSILKTDSVTNNEIIELINPTLENGVYKFETTLDINLNSKIQAFSNKFGKDVLSLESYFEPTNAVGFLLPESNNNNNTYLQIDSGIRNFIVLHDTTKEDLYTIYIHKKEDFELNCIPDSYLILDDIKYNYADLEKGLLTISSGLHKLTVKKADWKETIDLVKYELLTITENKIQALNRETNVIEEEEFVFDKTSMYNNSIYLQLFQQNVSIYLNKETIFKKYDKNYVEYFYKNNPYNTYIFNESKSKTVETVRFRITLKSIDNKTCPYVSKLILKGV